MAIDLLGPAKMVQQPVRSGELHAKIPFRLADPPGRDRFQHGAVM